MPSRLDGLKQWTTIVADTGDLAAIERLRPRDATTNPSLILKAAQKPEYRPLLADSAARAPDGAGRRAARPRPGRVRRAHPRSLIDGRVSTEVDARLSFDTRATIEKARHLIALYEALGAPRERVLIKIASTWEGIRAAEVLEREGIHCNLTLLFAMPQAEACAQAGVTLISPFVGRIYDWHKKAAGSQWDEAAMSGDSGSRRTLRARHLRATQGRRLSHRGDGSQLPQRRPGAGARRLRPADDQPGTARRTVGLVRARCPAPSMPTRVDAPPPIDLAGERASAGSLNEDAMATEKLAEGIRAFAADTVQAGEDHRRPRLTC